MELLKDKVLGVAFCFVGGLLPTMKPIRKDLTGKIAVVTGSNSGIGYGLALQLAEMGATVYLACRSETRAAQAMVNHFDKQPGNKRLVYSWEPGLVKSNLLRDIADTPHDPAIWLLGKLQPIVGLDVRQGSATGVHLAASDSVRVIQNSGRYFDRMQPRLHDADWYTQQKLDLLFARWSADAEVSWEG